MNPSQQKAALRQQQEALRDALAPSTRAALSEALCARAMAQQAFVTAELIHCFLPMRSELDLRPLIRAALAAGKRVATPIFKRDSAETPCALIESLEPAAFVTTPFGLSRPKQIKLVDPLAIDIVYVPLLGFAREQGKWHRIGYGAGFYDTFLSRLAPHTLKIGVAFPVLRVAGIPVEAHDTPLDDVLIA